MKPLTPYRCLFLGYLWKGMEAIVRAPDWKLVTVGLEPQRQRSKRAEEYCDDQRICRFDARRLQENETFSKFLGDGIDLIVVGAFGQILPCEIIEAPSIGILNAHPSLLPAYRGGTVIEEQILKGETSGGATVHWLTESVDGGPVAIQRNFPIEPNDYYNDVFERFHDGFSEALSELLAHAPETWDRSPQEDGGTLYPPRRESDATLDWSLTAKELERRIRAFGWRGWCTVKLQRKPVCVRCAKVEPSPPNALPGEVLEISPSPLIATSEGGLRIEDWPDGTDLVEGQVLSIS